MSFLRFLIFSNLWISCGAIGLTALTLLIFKGVINDWELLLLNGTATLFIYNLQVILKNVHNVKSSSYKIEWIKSNLLLIKTLLAGSIVSLCVLIFFIPFDYLLMLTVLTPFALFYSYNPFSNSVKGLRTIPSIKIVLISLVWTGVTALVPSLYVKGIWDNEIIIYSIGVFCFIFSITIPFDIRDLDYDQEKMATIPQLIGTSSSKLIALLLSAVAFLLVYLVIQSYSIVLIVNFILNAILILLSTKDRPDIYYTGLIDGTMIMLPVSLILAEYLI